MPMSLSRMQEEFNKRMAQRRNRSKGNHIVISMSEEAKLRKKLEIVGDVYTRRSKADAKLAYWRHREGK